MQFLGLVELIIKVICPIQFFLSIH